VDRHHLLLRIEPVHRAAQPGGRSLRDGQLGVIFAGALWLLVPFAIVMPGMMAGSCTAINWPSRTSRLSHPDRATHARRACAASSAPPSPGRCQFPGFDAQFRLDDLHHGRLSPLLDPARRSGGWSAEFHVAIQGNDTNPGTRKSPLRTIQRAADLAQPGDTITVHAGTYRERVNPPRGGTLRRTAHCLSGRPGSAGRDQRFGGHQGLGEGAGGVWKVTLPNAFFGWISIPTPTPSVATGSMDADAKHHTGAVYLNGDWLTEAVTLDEVLLPRPA
jgi:hypothetical protein